MTALSSHSLSSLSFSSRLFFLPSFLLLFEGIHIYVQPVLTIRRCPCPCKSPSPQNWPSSLLPRHFDGHGLLCTDRFPGTHRVPSILRRIPLCFYSTDARCLGAAMQGGWRRERHKGEGRCKIESNQIYPGIGGACELPEAGLLLECGRIVGFKSVVDHAMG